MALESVKDFIEYIQRMKARQGMLQQEPDYSEPIDRVRQRLREFEEAFRPPDIDLNKELSPEKIADLSDQIAKARHDYIYGLRTADPQAYSFGSSFLIPSGRGNALLPFVSEPITGARGTWKGIPSYMDISGRDI